MLKTFKKKVAIFIMAFFIAILGGLTLSGCMADGKNGENGANGSKWLTGVNVPTMALGADGDMYLNTESHILYQKVNGSWVIIMNNFGSGGGTGTDGKDGADGKDGSTWITGTDNPTSLQGKAGDFYLNSTTCDVFFKTEAGWGTPIVNIKGAAGENGEDGTTPTITVNQEGVILINGVETELKKFMVDETLKNSGEAADAKIVGDKLAQLENDLNNGQIDIDRLSSYQNTIIYNKTNLITEGFKWSSGYINFQTGTIGTNIKYSCTETYIPVEEEKTYFFFADKTCKQVKHYAFYDEGKLFLSGSKDSTDMITAPVGAKYLRFSVVDSMLNPDKVLAGEYTLEFYNQTTRTYSEPKAIAKITGLDAEETIIDGSITVDKCNFFDKIESPNLLGEIYPDSIVSPGSSDVQQNEYSSAYLALTDIPVVAGKIVNVYNSYGQKLQFRMVAEFDASGAPIKRTQESGVNINVSDFVVPADTAFVSLTIYKTTYEKNTEIQVQCTTKGVYLGKYYEPGVAIYKLKDQYFEYSANKNKTIHAYLPSELCVAEGKTIELYNSQICLEHKNYHFQWIANGFGRPFERKFSITGTSNLTGQTKTLTLNIVDDSLEIVYTASCTVKFVSNKIEQQQLIIPIGDSLTNNKAWLKKIYDDSEGKIKFRGTQGTTDKTVDNGITHEGRSGAGTNWYSLGTSKYGFNPTNTTLDVKTDETGNKYTTNPFWNPSTDAFDFDYYCNSKADGGAGYFQDADGNEISIVPTGIQIYLGTNGISLDSTDAVNNINGLINRLKNSVKGANIPIYVVNTLFRPSQIFAVNSDGYATNNAGEFSFQADMKVMNLETALYNRLKDVENVFFVPVAATHDSEYNFPYEDVPVNPYVTNITTRHYTDCVHPSQAGYYQMADIMYSTIAAHYKDYVTA